jgi:hypothetical protein
MTFWPAVLELRPVLYAYEQNASQRQTHTLELLPHRWWNDYGDRKETANDVRRLALRDCNRLAGTARPRCRVKAEARYCAAWRELLARIEEKVTKRINRVAQRFNPVAGGSSGHRHTCWCARCWTPRPRTERVHSSGNGRTRMEMNAVCRTGSGRRGGRDREIPRVCRKGGTGCACPVRQPPSTAGRYCREFQQQVAIGGHTERAYGTACRQPDGSWEVCLHQPLSGLSVNGATRCAGIFVQV